MDIMRVARGRSGRPSRSFAGSRDEQGPICNARKALKSDAAARAASRGLWPGRYLLLAAALGACKGDTPSTPSAPLPPLSGSLLVQAGPAADSVSLYRIALGSGTVEILASELSPSTPVSVSPDGQHVLTGGRDGHLYDLQRNRVLPVPLGRSDRPAWGPESDAAYMGVYYDGIYRYRPHTREATRMIGSGLTYDHSVAVSPDGETVVWAHHEFGHRITIRRAPVEDFRDWTAMASLRSYEYDEEIATAFVDSGRVLLDVSTISAEGRLDQALLVLHLATARLDTVVSLPSGEIRGFEISPDREHVVYYGYDSWSILRASDLTRILTVTTAPTYGIEGIAWSPDSRYIGSLVRKVGSDVQLLLYEPATRQHWVSSTLPMRALWSSRMHWIR